MSRQADIPVTVRAEVTDFVAEIGERTTYERMLEHIPVHFAGVRSIDVTLELPHNDFNRGPHVLFVVVRSDPGNFHEADAKWNQWVMETFSPTEYESFSLCSARA